MLQCNCNFITQVGHLFSGQKSTQWGAPVGAGLWAVEHTPLCDLLFHFAEFGSAYVGFTIKLAADNLVNYLFSRINVIFPLICPTLSEVELFSQVNLLTF